MSTSNSRDRKEKECQGRNMLLFCYNKVKNTEREIKTINKGDNLRLKNPANKFKVGTEGISLKA